MSDGRPVFVVGDYARLAEDRELLVRNPPTAPDTFSAYEVLFRRVFQLPRVRYK